MRKRQVCICYSDWHMVDGRCDEDEDEKEEEGEEKKVTVI